MTTEFVKARNLTVDHPFCLIEQKGLFARLGEELSRAASELIHDPRAFFGGLFATADTRDQKRRRLIYIGLGGGLLLHATLLVVMVVAGWHRIMEAPKDARPPGLRVESWLPPKQPDAKIESGTETAPKGDAHVRGGGGQQNEASATVGAKPQSLPQLPMVRPNLTPPENPAALAITPNIQGPEEPPLPRETVLGDPNGKPGEPSAGRGTGDGIGDGKGSGVGSKSGSGGRQGGPGNHGSPEGGKIDGSGTAITSLMYNAPKPAGFVGMQWIYRATAVTTPEAQANKVSGVVLVIATFRADGTITDIELKNPVPYMTESAIDSLKRCRFRPASVDGKPITLFRVPVRISVGLVSNP